MTSLIHILDSNSANQIAAGEVVERPASVVKELAENALDAGAKHIDIAVEGNGVPFIRIRDDGFGIGASDLPLSVIRHATSKIKQIKDLDDLQTLGFRGEALPSVASVSNLEIISRPAEEIVGYCLQLEGGEQKDFGEVGCPAGTSVTVRNLFFNTPARLKFLKSISTEFGQISDIIGRMALAHPEVAFSLTHPRQAVLQTSGRGDLRETIGSVLGHEIARKLIPVKARQEDWLLEGYISPPDLVRSTKQAQTFMINGRIVRSPFLSRALEEGYHTLIPLKLHPVVVLHLHVRPSDYDVNVHPTKMDVRFKNEPDLLSFIREAVYQTLIKSKPLPLFQMKPELPRQPVLINRPVPISMEHNYQQNSRQDVTPKLLGIAEGPERIRVEQTQPMGTDLQKIEISYTPNEQTSSVLLSEESDIPRRQQEFAEQTKLFFRGSKAPDISVQGSLPETQDILDSIWPLAQVFNTYILATDGESLLMIDQHAAHERINYEELLTKFRNINTSSQALLIPIPMEFTLQEEQVLLENLWVLTEMGFVLEQFGAQTYLIRGVPILTGNLPADLLLRQFLEEVLQKNSKPNLDKLLEEWIYLLACKESIKAQESLSILEMEQLIVRLKQTENPYTCPHGRPTMIKLTRSEIERRFYRT